jgi:hypothetical protein
VTVDDIRRHLQAQHDQYLEDLIREAQTHQCTTDDVIRGLVELGGAGASGAGGIATSETGLVSISASRAPSPVVV